MNLACSGGGSTSDDGGGTVTEDEDAYDMRKALSRDTEKKSVIPLTRPVHMHELEYWKKWYDEENTSNQTLEAIWIH